MNFPSSAVGRRLFALAAGALLASCVSGTVGPENNVNAISACPEAIRISERGNPVGVESGHIRHCWPGEAHCFCDSDEDCYAEDGYIPCIPLPTGGGADAGPDVSAADASVADAASDDVASVDDATADVAVTDIASEDVAITDVASEDAAVTDVASEDAAITDVASEDVAIVDAAPVDAGPATCPEGVRISARGNPVGLISGHIRFCWPGEARCFCDSDNDCYAEAGYVACVPPTSGATDAGSSVDATTPDVAIDTTPVDVAAADSPALDAGVDAPPLAPDPVGYSGSLSGASGAYTTRVIALGESRNVWVYAPSTRGPNPPLVVAFHGTNADGDVMMSESGLRALADAQGLVVVAPDARWFGGEGADYDHPGGNGTYWETSNADPDTNADLVLTRALLVEASRRYGTDPDRVYVMGHSNGGFMSLLVSVVLRDRIAAFAENSAGMVTCATRPDCYFQGAGSTCGALSTQSGWCGCTGHSQPVALPTSGRQAPGYLAHGAQDPIVSVFYTCALASRMSAAGIPSQVALRDGGHDLPSSFARNAWSFLSTQRRR